MRPIDADALFESIMFDREAAKVHPREMCERFERFCDYAEGLVKEAPTIDAEPVRHGKYGFVGMDMMAGSRAFYFGTCSECHERINFEAKHKNYCPNCGAKMDAEVQDGI